ncbi:ABC transporter G family member 20-like [Bradysia coprophila]|uniref:ABC transporter G family member 20-like n=1 Tax=Bradysia coprophila TaxID=38358 RepID=UPI00187DBCB5|nr:ABC transporter G family member 20-like [Bradysia coprophila]
MVTNFSRDMHTIEKCENMKSCSKSVERNMDSSGQAYNQMQPAVSVRNAFKQYGSKSKPNPVLLNLNMTVAKGTIYGLLGASGCGKTTLLSCIVNRRKLDSGKIWILGGESGTKDVGAPGKRVGYMPQELALYGEFTIKETMLYFGWIFGMKTNKIYERLQFLLDFLDLPSQNRFIKNLSGGQQRRVSFAVALLHDPDLLILDEPTVGVDPLLRQNIWNHLSHLSKTAQKTIIITTHYIEEARQAHMIGLMRSGRFLAEESPQTLMAMYSCTNLESIFLKLSRKQGTSNEVSELNISSSSGFRNKLDAPVYISQDSGVIGLNFYQSKEVLITSSNNNQSSFGLNGSISALVPNLRDIQFDDFSEEKSMNKVTFRRKQRALLKKNFLRIWRNLPILLFCFLAPIVQIVIFCLAIGRDPHGLTLAIANMEVNGTECNFEPGCHFQRLSCRYLSLLNPSYLRQYHNDSESAIEAVKTGQAWAAIYFNANFSVAMVGRMLLGRTASDEVLDQSEIQMWFDLSNQQISSLMNRDIQMTYLDFSQGLLKDCDNNPKLGNVPIRTNEPIYGSSTSTFTDFAVPGIVLTIIFFLAVALTATTLIVERAEGLWDRSWVAGVSSSEILFSQVITQFVAMCGQTALVLIFVLVVFRISCIGSTFLAIGITLLQGMNGMCFGFLISAICETEHSAFPLAIGSFYPIMLLSGVVWPIEGMPLILRYISYFLPLTQATTAFRSVLARGWGLCEPEVYLGYISTVSWIILFLVITLVVLKYKRM